MTDEIKRCQSYPGYSIMGTQVISHWRIVYTRGVRGAQSKIDYRFRRYLKPYLAPNLPRYSRYPMVSVRRATGGHRPRAIHTMITDAHLGPKPKVLDVRHLDGDPHNNEPGNLSYGTRKENAQDAIGHGTLAKGESSHLSKLTERQVLRIRLMHETGASIKKISEVYNISVSYVHRLIKRSSWKHI